MRRVLAAIAAAMMLASGCSTAPDAGDLAAFCSLLESGTGLSPSPTSGDLERLVLVAPPAVRETVEALQTRARDFNELLTVDPPDLEALFKARFDQQAASERLALDTYAESSCGIAIERTPTTRWNNYVRENFADAPWVSMVNAGFDVDNDRIATATIGFLVEPEPVSLVEDVCRAVSEFLLADGAEPGRVRVFIGPVVALDYDSPNGLCRLP